MLDVLSPDVQTVPLWHHGHERTYGTCLYLCKNLVIKCFSTILFNLFSGLLASMFQVATDSNHMTASCLLIGSAAADNKKKVVPQLWYSYRKGERVNGWSVLKNHKNRITSKKSHVFNKCRKQEAFQLPAVVSLLQIRQTMSRYKEVKEHLSQSQTGWVISPKEENLWLTSTTSNKLQ